MDQLLITASVVIEGSQNTLAIKLEAADGAKHVNRTSVEFAHPVGVKTITDLSDKLEPRGFVLSTTLFEPPVWISEYPLLTDVDRSECIDSVRDALEACDVVSPKNAKVILN